MKGGCACGAVRFRLASAPTDIGYCHCRTCQLNSGSPAMVFGTVSVADWIAEQGGDRLKSFKSSDVGRRTFCGDCGTPLYVHVEHQADTVDLSIATLDEPDAHAPGFHIYIDSNIAWFDTADTLPRHAKLRSETRGLPSGQTELG